MYLSSSKMTSGYHILHTCFAVLLSETFLSLSVAFKVIVILKERFKMKLFWLIHLFNKFREYKK